MKQKIFPIFILSLTLACAVVFLLFCEEKQALATSGSIQELSSISFFTDEFEHHNAYGHMVCYIPYDNALGQPCEKDSLAELKMLNETLLPKEDRCYRLKLTDEKEEKNPLSLANLDSHDTWELHPAKGCGHFMDPSMPCADILFYLDAESMGNYILISESSQ